jgi:hemerythrin-like domain-containing protein
MAQTSGECAPRGASFLIHVAASRTPLRMRREILDASHGGALPARRSSRRVPSTRMSTDMRATETLSADHRIIERVIGALSVAAERLDDGEDVPARFFLDAVRFIREFADGCHHRKEERVLFTTMAEHGMPTESGPIAVMLYDHERGREFTGGLHAAAERLAAGDASAKRDVVDNAIGYAELLRAHIRKEDHVLFPMADRVIPPGEHDDVMARFEAIDREQPNPDTQEHYRALAESLESQMARVASV